MSSDITYSSITDTVSLFLHLDLGISSEFHKQLFAVLWGYGGEDEDKILIADNSDIGGHFSLPKSRFDAFDPDHRSGTTIDEFGELTIASQHGLEVHEFKIVPNIAQVTRFGELHLVFGGVGKTVNPYVNRSGLPTEMMSPDDAKEAIMDRDDATKLDVHRAQMSLIDLAVQIDKESLQSRQD